MATDWHDMNETHPALERSRERLEAQTERSLTCGRCGSPDWAVWRSILGSARCQDDVMVKCLECWCVAWHGIPMVPEEWDEELEVRGKRTIDAVGDAEGDYRERLRALGYLGGTEPSGEYSYTPHSPERGGS